jgi:23S rRNA pseudouridine1911/1915/1917 synthase
MRLSRRMLQRLTRSKGITLNRRAAYLGRKVRAGDKVEARAADQAAAPALTPYPMELSIAYEDEDLIVIDKPAGLLVHPTHPASPPTLAHGLAHRFAHDGSQTAVRPVHRLDRDTSGLIVVAKSGYAHQQLDRQLREGALEREYVAIVEGVVGEDQGVIDAPIGRVQGDFRKRAVRAGGDPARTNFEVIRRGAEATVLKVRLETGRTHQIRVHMEHIGHPVIGDPQYGGRSSNLRRQALHAARISFRQPRTGEAVTCTAPLPPDMLELLDRL